MIDTNLIPPKVNPLHLQVFVESSFWSWFGLQCYHALSTIKNWKQWIISHSSSYSLLLQVIRLHEEFFLPGEVIMEKGNVVDQLYFVCLGKLVWSQLQFLPFSIIILFMFPKDWWEFLAYSRAGPVLLNVDNILFNHGFLFICHLSSLGF